MKKIAIVITPMCQVSRGLYGIRLERRGNTWFKTWSFPIKPTSHENFNSDAELDLSEMDVDPNFPGCPYCQSKSLVQCGDCGKIYCYEGESESTCPWCGNTGMIGDGGWDSVAGGGY
ncbi:MAG: hypothetical protein IKR40_04590 [Treponema sp.]|nr:hypothetical protein [Treponema sp.]